MGEKLKITKLDAARRQLQTAVELWFSDADPVSIHTLVYAAHEIIYRTYRDRGYKNLSFDTSVIKEEYRSAFNLSLKKAANFFKHSDRGKGATLEFDAKINDNFLLVSICALPMMNETLSQTEAAFLFWSQVHNPSLFNGGVFERFKHLFPVDEIDQVRSASKLEFFHAFNQA